VDAILLKKQVRTEVKRSEKKGIKHDILITTGKSMYTFVSYDTLFIEEHEKHLREYDDYYRHLARKKKWSKQRVASYLTILSLWNQQVDSCLKSIYTFSRPTPVGNDTQLIQYGIIQGILLSLQNMLNQDTHLSEAVAWLHIMSAHLND